MGLKNTPDSYGGVTRFIHWVTAALIVVMIPLGLYMNELESSPFKVSLYFIHKSLGVFVLGLTGLRLFWLLTNAKPALLGALSGWERKLAHIVHGLFYVALFGVPLTGWMMSSAKGYPVSVYGWFTLPDLVGKSHALGEAMEELHELGAWGLVGLLAVHLIGVWKHEGVYKDDTLSRMMPRRKLWFIGLPVLLVLAFIPAYGKALHAGPGTAVEKLTNVFTDDDDDDDEMAAPDDHHADVTQWIVDRDNIRLQFVFMIEGAEMQGSFNAYDADIRFSPDDLEHSVVDVRVDMSSVNTGNDERDTALRSAPWFNVPEYPEARFFSDDFKKTGEDSYRADGELEIRGNEQAAEMPFTVEFSTNSEGGKVALMQGQLTIDRTLFGLGGEEWKDASSVAHEVRVEVSLRATAQGAGEERIADDDDEKDDDDD